MSASIFLLPLIGLLSVVYYFVLRWKRKKANSTVRMALGIDRNRQAIEMPGQPGVYRSGLLIDRTTPLERFYPEVGTLYEAFIRGLEVSENGDCLGYRPSDNSEYYFLSYADVFRNAKDFASALLTIFHQQPNNSTFLGIYAKNSPEWMISALASIQQSIVIVPLYDTLGPEAASYIINQTQIEVMVAENEEKAVSLLECKHEMPSLKHIVLIEAAEIGEELKEKAQNADVSVSIFKEVINEGRKVPQEKHLPSPDDLYIICYTSGTTGIPKGVMLSHANIIANLSAISDNAAKLMPSVNNPDQTLISYLPLSHMMEQMFHWFCLQNGSRIGYFRGNVIGLTEDMKVLKPTFFPVVPRLLNRLYDKIQYMLIKAGPIAKFIFNAAYNAKLRELKAGLIWNDSIWDKLVFRKLHDELGGNVRFMVTGSAPISAEVLETCRVTMGAVVLEGWTEYLVDV